MDHPREVGMLGSHEVRDLDARLCDGLFTPRIDSDHNTTPRKVEVHQNQLQSKNEIQASGVPGLSFTYGGDRAGIRYSAVPRCHQSHFDTTLVSDTTVSGMEFELRQNWNHRTQGPEWPHTKEHFTHAAVETADRVAG